MVAGPRSSTDAAVSPVTEFAECPCPPAKEESRDDDDEAASHLGTRGESVARIAIVEDEATVAECLSYSLGALGHEVVVYRDGGDAARALELERPQLLILDLMLPGVDGLSLCAALRAADPHLPIMILTARSHEIDRVVGLEAGADDYVVKPFSVREIEARVKSLLRRAGLGLGGSDSVRVGRFDLDRRRGEFRMDGVPVSLTRRQMDLLDVLVGNHGTVIGREDLLRRVWGHDYAGEAKTLDVHIRWLREKIEADPANPRHIVTVRGRGYRFDSE